MMNPACPVMHTITGCISSGQTSAGLMNTLCFILCVCNFRLLLFSGLQCRIWIGFVLEEDCTKRSGITML